MAGSSEHRAAVEYCFQLGKNAAETVENSLPRRRYGETQVYEWIAQFKNGDMSIDDKPPSELPSAARIVENVEEILELYPQTDNYSTVRE